MVLPQQYPKRVLELAHDVPMAGHLGRERTLKRIRRCFWWPSVAKDVADYCRTCVECQKLAGRGQRVPLVPIPIIGESFERIAMEVIGPLPKTAAPENSLSWLFLTMPHAILKLMR